MKRVLLYIAGFLWGMLKGPLGIVGKICIGSILAGAIFVLPAWGLLNLIMHIAGGESISFILAYAIAVSGILVKNLPTIK